MKTGVIVGSIVIVVIVGALLFFQADPAPEEEVAEDIVAEDLFEPEPEDATPFLETGPTPSPAATPVTETSEASTIAIDETGFSPQTVTVAAGSEVTFVNNGQAKHWPASAVHPTHQLLPGFDAKRGLETGEEYTFTFTQAGTWGCHDHLNPTFTCEITVE